MLSIENSSVTSCLSLSAYAAATINIVDIGGAEWVDNSDGNPTSHHDLLEEIKPIPMIGM